MARANAQANDVAHVDVSARQDSRWASRVPHTTAAAPIRMAGTVPQPTWAFHQPKIGAASANALRSAGLILMMGVTMPRCRFGTTNAAYQQYGGADNDGVATPDIDSHQP